MALNPYQTTSLGLSGTRSSVDIINESAKSLSFHIDAYINSQLAASDSLTFSYISVEETQPKNFHVINTGPGQVIKEQSALDTFDSVLCGTCDTEHGRKGIKEAVELMSQGKSSVLTFNSLEGNYELVEMDEREVGAYGEGAVCLCICRDIAKEEEEDSMDLTASLASLNSFGVGGGR